MEQDKIYLTGLNGIRAFAACGVLLSHTNLSLKYFNISTYSLFGFNQKGEQLSYLLGRHGVTMFFVLSGFLITFLLLKEINKKSKINVPSFYMRRILRIWPLYFLYFFLCLFFLYIYKDTIPPAASIFYYLFFLANIPFILGHDNFLFNHLWSIAVEEQFYLFWPHLFKFKKNLIKILIIIIVFMGVGRVLSWYFFPYSFLSNLMSINRFDCMIWGGLLAILLYQKSKYIEIINTLWVQIVAWVIMFLMILNIFKVFNSVIEFWIVSLMTGIIIIGQVKGNNKVINLENKFFNYIGVLSFGIYVYHKLVIYLLSKSHLFDYIDNELVRTVVVFISVILLTIVLSKLSYKYIEARFLNLKDKFQVVKSTNKASA